MSEKKRAAINIVAMTIGALGFLVAGFGTALYANINTQTSQNTDDIVDLKVKQSAMIDHEANVDAGIQQINNRLDRAQIYPK
ncbi:MAG: hypothetical protein KGL39_32880 [Patescibacteria group bacterium]|nr:hypothetical protein [Patescibacteria group bacterium]